MGYTSFRGGYVANLSIISAVVGLSTALCLGVPGAGMAQSRAPATDRTIPAGDAARVAEARRLAAWRGTIWPGWEATPMPILLVTESTEFLVNGIEPGRDFTPASPNPALGGTLHVRERKLNPGLLATFPWFAGGPTIVIGQAGRTGKTSGEWAVTVMHEHFHQFQYGQPGYLEGVKALDLSGGDETGMWMLNFPFPYDAAPVAARADALKRALLSYVGSPADATTHRRTVCHAMEALHAQLTPAEQRYLQFQLWQEGVPRYIELRVAGAAAAAGTSPAPAFLALPDVASYSTVAATLEKGLRNELSAPFSDLDRVNFYAMGAALALLMDATSPGWKANYHKAGFRLDTLLRC